MDDINIEIKSDSKSQKLVLCSRKRLSDLYKEIYKNFGEFKSIVNSNNGKDIGNLNYLKLEPEDRISGVKHIEVKLKPYYQVNTFTISIYLYDENERKTLHEGTCIHVRVMAKETINDVIHWLKMNLGLSIEDNLNLYDAKKFSENIPLDTTSCMWSYYNKRGSPSATFACKLDMKKIDEMQLMQLVNAVYSNKTDLSYKELMITHTPREVLEKLPIVQRKGTILKNGPFCPWRNTSYPTHVTIPQRIIEYPLDTNIINKISNITEFIQSRELMGRIYDVGKHLFIDTASNCLTEECNPYISHLGLVDGSTLFVES